MSLKIYVKKHPVVSYYVATFTISWLAALAVVSPHLFAGEALTKLDGLLMFPVMIIGPCAVSIVLTAIIDGRTGLRSLSSRITKWRVAIGWYAFGLCIWPFVVIIVLLLLRNFSTAFKPNFFPIGFLFSIPAGLLEEIGWTGFALPKLLSTKSIPVAGVIVGLLWGLWHFPVIDFLGAATPHGAYLIPFFLSFICLVAVVRVLMTWVYAHTHSILVIQLMHISFTGCLVMLGPSHISPGQETLWYAVYAGLLWCFALVIVRRKAGRRDEKIASGRN